ncbi:MAG TPA: TldD/PmbA family protein, partial [Ardenticatenaceae bacterium]|nr:TldD/PmbA family protein [Ardenticatenaceae bacterium]
YMQLARDLVERAARQGVEAEVGLGVGRQSDVMVARGEVEKLSRAGSKGLGVRVIRDGRMGYAYTSDFSPESLSKTVAAAISLAEVADGDEYRRLPDPRPVDGDQDLQIDDPAIAEMAMDAHVDFARRVEAAALAADERVVMTNRCTFFSHVQEVYLANSKGFSGQYRKTFAAGYLMAMARDGEERATGFHMQAASRLADLDPEALGAEAGRKAVGLLGGRPVPTQRAPVVYSPYAAAQLLGAVARALTARAMQRNRSFLQGKMGTVVASDVVTLLDNGRLPGGLATRPFDDEGVPTSATRLIDEGVLQAVLYDSYTAARDGTTSTGNADRSSHREVPTLMPSNFYLQPGLQSPQEVIAAVESGLYVENVMNSHSVNPITGDYSVSAQGYWIEGGRLTHPVNEVTIALPLGELLQNVRAVADDLRFFPVGGVIGSPTLRVDGVMIGGQG